MMYVVYTEILNGKAIERWYYGTYDYDRANEVAYELGGEYPVYHCVCPKDEAKAYGIKNLPCGF